MAGGSSFAIRATNASFNAGSELSRFSSRNATTFRYSGRCLRFVELAVVDERQHGIRRVRRVVVAQVVREQLIVIGTVIASGLAGEFGKHGRPHLAQALALFCSLVFALRLGRRQPFVLDRLVLRQATRLLFLATAAGAAIVASGLGHQGLASG